MGDSAKPNGRQQRQLKNLLLDPGFQLKYAGYLVAIAVFLGGSLGLVLWQTSGKLVAQSERNVAQGERVVALGDEVVDESRKVSAVVRMNIVKDPVYQNDPDLLEAFNTEAAEQDRRLASQKATLEQQKISLAREAESLRAFQATLLWTLLGVLGLLVVAIGAAGIVVTHKVAGPVFKMKRHLREVAAGDLRVPWGLRKGDELVEFFEAFRDMVRAIRERRAKELQELRAAIAELEAEVPRERLEKLEALATDLERSLED